MTVVTLVLIVVLGEAFLHYFRWKQVLLGRELPRVAAYTLGVLGMMVPFTMWLLEHGEVALVRVLWTVIVAGGLAVGLCYFIDWVVDLVWDRMQSHKREQAMTDQLRNHNEQGE